MPAFSFRHPIQSVRRRSTVRKTYPRKKSAAAASPRPLPSKIPSVPSEPSAATTESSAAAAPGTAVRIRHIHRRLFEAAFLSERPSGRDDCNTAAYVRAKTESGGHVHPDWRPSVPHRPSRFRKIFFPAVSR